MNTTTTADEMQKLFFEWLGKRVTPSQLSAFYQAYVELDMQLQDNKFGLKSNTGLSSNADVNEIENIYNNLCKTPKFTRSTRSGLKIAVLRYYIQYLKESNNKKVSGIKNGLFDNKDILIQRLKNDKIIFTDNRTKDGALWISLNAKTDAVIRDFKSYGMHFYYSDRKKQWWTKDSSPSEEEHKIATDHSSVFSNKNNSIKSNSDNNERFSSNANGISTNGIYLIKTKYNTYEGRTPSEALLKYCEDIARKKPLIFRFLIGAKIGNTNEKILSRKREEVDQLELSYPTAYISSKLSLEKVFKYAKMVCSTCHSPDTPEYIGRRDVIEENKSKRSTQVSSAIPPFAEHQDVESGIPDQYVDFTSNIDYSIYFPKYIKYRDEYKEEKSWVGVYLDLCRYLYSDYSDEMTQLVRKKKTNSTDSIYNHYANDYTKGFMSAPRSFAPGCYLEIGISTSSIIKRIRELWAFFNLNDIISIAYISSNTQNKTIDQKKVTVNREKGIFKSYPPVKPLEEKKNDRRVDSAAVSDLKTTNPTIATSINQTVSPIEKYKEKNSESSETTIAEQLSFSNELNVLLTGEEFAPLRKVLVSQRITTVNKLKTINLWSFMNRYNVYSIGTRQIIFSKVNAMLFPESEVSDDQAFVLNIGEDCYKGITPAETFRQYCNKMLIYYPLQIRLLIGMRSSSGSIPIQKSEGEIPSLKLNSVSAYIRANLSVDDVISYVSWVRNRCGEGTTTITISKPQNAELSFKQVSANDFVDNPQPKVLLEPTRSSQEPVHNNTNAYVKQIEQIVLDADSQGVSYNEVKDAISATMAATKRAVANSELIVDVKGRLIHEDAFIDWEDGADQLESIIDKLMQKNSGYISAAQLYEYAKVEMNMFLTDNDINDERSVFDIAKHLFEKNRYHNKHYIFSGKTHISNPNHLVTSNLDIFRNYATDQGGIFSFESLVDYLHRIDVATGNLRMQMRIPDEPIFFYYESGVLMCADSMHIDETWKSTVKKELVSLFTDVGDHIVLRAIPDIWFERLPALPGGRTWTPLLLQSILRCYSKALGAKTIQALIGQSLDTIHTMLVENSSPIQSFGDVIISCLFDNDIKKRSFDAEELRLLLVEVGILQGNELIWNMPKALNNDERFAWNASGDHVIVEV